MIEQIEKDGKLYCLVIKPPKEMEETIFATPDALNLQVGFIVYGAGHEVPRHAHRDVERQVRGTSEVIIVRQGRCVVDIYDDARSLIAERELAEGDVVVLVAGGHGFRMQEDTILTEVKQGPYSGLEEKERF